MILVRVLLVLCIFLVLTTETQGRETISLDGPWDFRMDPKDVGISEAWFESGVPFDQKVTVPGTWNAQGIGAQSEKLFHDFPGPGWYRRTMKVPAKWQGKVVWPKFGGVHRYADVWVNGKHVGEHIGYLTPFKYDISKYITPGQDAVIAVRVDARQRKDIDPLIGCFDIIDAMDVTWGGMYRGVDLEVTNKAWIEDVFVIPHIATKTAEVRVEIGGPVAENMRLHVDLVERHGEDVASAQADLQPGQSSGIVNVKFTEPFDLWTPKRPEVYKARVRLLDGSRDIDKSIIPFGMREIAVKDGKFMLNGKPIFLRGYGDDCIFPNAVAPTDPEEFGRRFSIARSYGFNYVRHHSWIPPGEYFDAADRYGIMLQPEFPIAYGHFYAQATPEGKKLYLQQWREIIKANRNHPSIIAWSMSNEMGNSFDIAPEMYRTAKELDPTRLVVDTDGVGLTPQGQKTRDTLDFQSVQFDEWGRFGFNDGKYDIAFKPDKPVVVHEMGNFCTLPSLDQIQQFKGGIRPFWLLQARDLAKQKGVLGRYPEWVECSNKLQALMLKTNIEAARMSPNMGGFDQWLLQDYWTGSNGVLGYFFREKASTPEGFREFNSPTVLLMDCPRRNYRSGESLQVTFLASRYEEDAIQGARFDWGLMEGGRVVAKGRRTGVSVPSGANTRLVTAHITMPKVTQPTKLSLAAELLDPGDFIQNSWDFWVFPDVPGVGSSGDLLVARRWNAKVVEHLEQGGRVLLLSPDGIFPTITSSFKPCWWLGGPGDSNVGTVIADHPAMRGFVHQGWCDLQFVNLLNSSKAMLLDDLPVKVEPIVRCLDVHTLLRNKAYLFEARVGKGRLLVSSFNLTGAMKANDPAAYYLLDRLTRYASGSDFQLKAELPMEYLKTATEKIPFPPDVPRVNGFVQTVSSTSGPINYQTHRDVSHRAWLVRETDGKQSVEWETAPVPANAQGRISFVWTAGMGFITMPSGRFTIGVNDKPVLDFDVTTESAKWKSADGASELVFDVQNTSGQDGFGIMYLTLPVSMLEPGKPAHISVTGAASDSARWFMLYDYQDTLEHEEL